MNTPSQTAQDILNANANANVNANEMVSCTACAKQLHISAATCPNCGASRRTSRYKSKTVAALFAFFLGNFGAHRFYLGQWRGVLYLLFFWLWVPGIVAFFEFIYFLIRDSKKWDNKYNEGIPAGPNDKSGGVIIVLLVVLGSLVSIAMIGIVAAVALPAYQDYTIRARVDAAVNQAQPVVSQMLNYYQKNGQYPTSNTQLGIQESVIFNSTNMLSVTPDGLRIEFIEAGSPLITKTLIMTPMIYQSSIKWQCSGSLDMHYRPAICGQ